MALTNYKSFLTEANNNDKEMKITITGLAEHHYQAFLELFYTMDALGSIGSSREIKTFVDGDGSFRADILVDGKPIKDFLDKEITDKLKSDMSNDKIYISGFE